MPEFRNGIANINSKIEREKIVQTFINEFKLSIKDFFNARNKQNVFYSQLSKKYFKAKSSEKDFKMNISTPIERNQTQSIVAPNSSFHEVFNSKDFNCLKPAVEKIDQNSPAYSNCLSIDCLGDQKATPTDCFQENENINPNYCNKTASFSNNSSFIDFNESTAELRCETPLHINISTATASEKTINENRPLSFTKFKESNELQCSTPLVTKNSNSIINRSVENVDYPTSLPITAEDENSSTKNITPENVEFPKIFSNLPKNNDYSKPLQKNAHNSSFLPISQFKDCTFFEGTFEISNSIWTIIFQNNKLNRHYYPFYFKHQIGQFVNNICLFIFKGVKYASNKKIKIYAVCKHNNYGCKKFKIDVDLETLSVVIHSSSINYCHKSKLTSHVKGLERKITKNNMLNKMPLNVKKECILKSEKSLIIKGNLQEIKSDTTFRKIKSEAMAHFDRDKEDLFDMFKMQKDHPEYIKEVSVPFCVQIYSKEQLELLCWQKKAVNFVVLHFDATGTVVRKPNDLSKRVFLYSGVILLYQTQRVAPIFEMITSEHYVKSIYKIFINFRFFCEKYSRWPLFDAVVTDFSFSNIHAIVRSCNMLTLVEYLTKSFNISINKKDIPDNLITIHLCCAHFLKMFSNDVQKYFSDTDILVFFKYRLAQVLQMDNLQMINEWYLHISTILSSPYHTDQVTTSLSKFNFPFSTNIDDEFNLTETPKCDEEFDNQNQSLYQLSPFYAHFKNISDLLHISFSDGGDAANRYYEPKFLDLLQKKYMPYCALWTSLMIKKSFRTCRFSNAMAENYFGYVKGNILEGKQNLKSSRFIRKSRANVLALHKEAALSIPKSNLTRQKQQLDKNDEHQSQERWNRKSRKINTYFIGRFMPNVDSNKPVQPIQTREEITELADFTFEPRQCLYCGAGLLDETSFWVQCNACSGWVHQACDDFSPNKTYSGDFICKLCVPNNLNVEKHPSENNDKTLYEAHLKTLELNQTDWRELEQTTRIQRDSAVWHRERRRRITASIFGKICKAKSETTKLNLVKSIVNPKKIDHIPSVRYGSRNEQTAINKYSESTKNIVEKAGLHVHKKFPFLGGSPDGLVGNDGVIEVKCPYSIRNLKIDEQYLDYLEENGNLKKNHEYYYQIQGLLEMTNRPWCDFVIFTGHDIKIQRIFRNTKFWANMFTNLKSFYFFYFLPYVVRPESLKIALEDRKWTTIKEITLLENGLVNDTNYYIKTESRDYTVAIFDIPEFHIREILISDFTTLNVTTTNFRDSWLTGIIVSIAMHLLNNNNHFQIIEEILSTNIFTNQEHTEHFLKKIRINSDRIAMPVIENNDHFCIIFIDFNKKTFTFIDPMGNRYYY
ncbi:unnamed protein product [Ceutorhynchus assimilis]|uniref:Zinc finger PHD-type domain-containing protein n=1 Tax=Ceutorhynchus assimilis TaxID=467358 RepID=A0A9N9MZ55_9CUCU|nr:unnamed protein product [Ceutorhynchus assimilis]